MAFGLCVALPGGLTCLFPVATTIFIRSGSGVSAKAVQRAFFVVPFLTEEVARVTGVDEKLESGSLSKTTRSGGVNDPMRPETRSEDLSWLIIKGQPSEIRVPVSPVNVTDVRRRARDFLDDPAQAELRMWTVANWKISVVTAAILSVLTLVYLANIAWWFVSLFRKNHDTLSGM